MKDERLHRMTIDITEDLWCTIKAMCAMRQITLRSLVVGLLMEWVSEERGKERSHGICNAKQ